MDIPRFEDHLMTAATPQSVGDAFQTFVYELLHQDYPDLHPFPAGGKDGGIDLVESRDGRRTVVECKYVGTDGLQAARQRWLEVAGHLAEHLSDATGPTRGQAQYGPWYRTDPPIGKYIFCVSSVLGNLEQSDKLCEEIANFFGEMAARHAHLAHLFGLPITVLDWNDLQTRLRRHPHLLFRWFRLARHYGLGTLDERSDYSTFRSYLFSDRLPYYSRRQHLGVTPAPDGADILDEEGLLRLIDGGHLTGLVLTGSGGVGKTRLTLEIGWLAQAEGWVVLRVLRRLRQDAVEHLAQSVTPETKVLLLIDYVETQRDFAELVEVLNDLNDSLGLRLRYVANCRASYYSTIATTERHTEVNISPVSEEPAVAGWFESYQQQTVRHILEHSGIEATERHLKICRDVPVFAVFMSYLRGTGRETELESLLEEQDFSRWLIKRLQLSLGDATVSPTLAQFVTLFPLPDTAANSAELKEHEVLFRRLATDGWIEKLPADETRDVDIWVMAHDVLADQILLSYFKGNPHTVENFVRGLLTLARRVGCLRSALITLQRLVDKPALKALDWPAVLDASIAEDPSAWRAVRDLLVRTSLLTPLQTIDLLGHHMEVWQGAEEQPTFQLAVGWLTRWALEQKGVELDQSQRSTLETWLQKTSAHATLNNYVITSGLKFCPELVSEVALNWIRTRPREFQTTYLMVAWLRQKLPPEQIAPFVEQWLVKFSDSSDVSFVFWAWLNAGGDKELVRARIAKWLVVHKAISGARFVYRSWLDAGGGVEIIHEFLKAWLAAHGADAEAQFVYQSWLDAGGEVETVQDYLKAWLEEHCTAPEARFVYQSWLDARGDKETIQKSLKAWLAAHGADAEAQFVYRSWLDAGGGIEVVRESLLAWLSTYMKLETANFVYRGWIDAGGSIELIQEHLFAWLDEHGASAEADFIFKAWLEKEGSFSAIRPHALQWLSRNYDREEAVFLTKFIAKQPDIPVETVKNVLNWCRKFSANEDAIWRLRQLGRHLLGEEVAEEVCAASEAVLGTLLSRNASLPQAVNEQTTALFSFLITAPGLHTDSLRGRVDELLLRWLRHPYSYGDSARPHQNNQRRNYVQRVVDLVNAGALSVSEDREALRRFLCWVNNWDEDEKLMVRPMLVELERKHPGPGLWDVVRFE
ncbi:MAG TPA: hypothetical protein VN282_19450 [Pyrinomonadaceae bacterium]|nr:hypothetical protein [Pyrinomonadaceae bacterium]